jgi:hypothetical protein
MTGRPIVRNGNKNVGLVRATGHRAGKRAAQADEAPQSYEFARSLLHPPRSPGFSILSWSLAAVKSRLEFFPRRNRLRLRAARQVMLLKQVIAYVVEPAIVMQEVLLVAGKPAMSELREYPFAGRPFFPAIRR